jgi:hypothetical protein
MNIHPLVLLIVGVSACAYCHAQKLRVAIIPVETPAPTVVRSSPAPAPIPAPTPWAPMGTSLERGSYNQSNPLRLQKMQNSHEKED